jgi:hypothetical protein
MKRSEETAWDLVGTFAASRDELSDLRGLLDGREDPYEVLDQITHRLIFDVLQIIRDDGYQARVQFLEEH